MIFLTVGTTKFPFNRLLKAVDEALISLNSKEELIVQKGESNYQFKYPKTQVFKEIPFNKMISYLKKARVVVTHGGPATIFLALRYGENKSFVVPRRKEFTEHTDNHQRFFVKYLAKKRLIKACFLGTDLVGELVSYVKEPEAFKNKVSFGPSNNLIQKLVSIRT